MGACCSQILDGNKYISNLNDVDSRISPVINPSNELQEEIISVVASSFCGDQNHEPELTWHWWFGEQHSDYNSETRKTLFQYYSRFCFYITYLYGVIYTVKDPLTNKIAGVAYMVPPGVLEDGKFMTTCRMIKTGIKVGGQPPDIQNQKLYGKDVSERGDVMQKIIGPVHKKHGKNPHWYLYVLAIRPEYQGKGYGGVLMKLFNSLADQDKCMSYLECTGQKKLGFYQKYGYKIIDQSDLEYQNKKYQHQIYMVARNLK